MEINERRSVFVELKDYCNLSKEDDFIEVTEWTNGEGYDVNINERQFMLTHGEFDALNKCIKKLSK